VAHSATVWRNADDDAAATRCAVKLEPRFIVGIGGDKNNMLAGDLLRHSRHLDAVGLRPARVHPGNAASGVAAS